MTGAITWSVRTTDDRTGEAVLFMLTVLPGTPPWAIIEDIEGTTDLRVDHMYPVPTPDGDHKPQRH